MRAFIINFNRLTLPKNMAEWLAKRGCEPVFVDNASTYEPLLEYYKSCGHHVVHMPENFGHTVMWRSNVLEQFHTFGHRYIVTDSDLDLSGVPDDFIDRLNLGLDRHKAFPKCGLSLEINDLPETCEGDLVKNHYEAKYWKHAMDAEFWLADTDTTLAMYRENVDYYTRSGIRCNRPYMAKHVPWYYANFESLPADEQYYFRTANGSSSGKNRLLK